MSIYFSKRWTTAHYGDTVSLWYSRIGRSFPSIINFMHYFFFDNFTKIGYLNKTTYKL